MITYKCRSCVGQMNLGEAGSFSCEYCGSKAFMSDKDFRGNLVFRKKLLDYYKALNDSKEFDYDSDTLWEVTDTVSFQMVN